MTIRGPHRHVADLVCYTLRPCAIRVYRPQFPSYGSGSLFAGSGRDDEISDPPPIWRDSSFYAIPRLMNESGKGSPLF